MKNIITAIREGRLYEAQEMIRKGLNRSMLSAVYSNCQPVMKETYGGAGAGVIDEDEMELIDECGCDEENDKKENSLSESMQLDEAKDKASWSAYLGRLNASVAEKGHAIAAARQRVSDLRKKKAKPESITKASEALAKKQEGLTKLKKRIGEAQKKYQEWIKAESDKAKKKRDMERKKTSELRKKIKPEFLRKPAPKASKK